MNLYILINNNGGMFAGRDKWTYNIDKAWMWEKNGKKIKRYQKIHGGTITVWKMPENQYIIDLKKICEGIIKSEPREIHQSFRANP